MTNIPPPAEELRFLDLELRRLDARRAQLLQRRAWLIGVLRTATAPASAPVSTAPRPVRAPEASPPNVQNVLLALGGILLTVAAIAFTLVSWGHLGIGGRGAVLAAVTLTALGVPALLLRRKLRSTAETVAALGIALTVLDAYALHVVALPEADALGYTAAASGVLAALWAAYGLVFRELRLPLPLAVASAQLPLFLWARAADAGEHGTVAALLVTAAFDVAVALRVGDTGVRAVTAVFACAAGLWGAAGAGFLSWSATDLPGAARAGALLLLAAAIALVAAWLITPAPRATGAAFAGGLLVASAAGGVLRVALPDAWTVPGLLACAVVMLAVVRTALPRPIVRGVAGAVLLVHTLAVLWTLPTLVSALAGPVNRAGKVWSGAPPNAADAVFADGLPVHHPTMASLVLAVVAGVLFAGARLLPLATTQTPGRSEGGSATRTPTAPATGPTAPPGSETTAPPGSPAPAPAVTPSVARAGALVLLWAAGFVLPPALELPYAAGVTAHIAVAAALLGAAARAGSRVLALTSLSLAGASSVSVAFLALATTSATLGTLAALTALFLAATVVAARRPEPVAGVAPAAVCAAVSYAAALACASGAAMDLRPEHTGLLMLVVPALAALAAARLGRHPLTPPVEITGAVAGGLAIVLTTGHATTLALALALGGVIAAGTALRADRRPVGYAAGVLFLLATWVRLAAWGVGTPEAYTLPVTVPALVIGVLRCRRAPETSSWAAYGPGLAATLLPSLVAAWSDAHWQRPLLLGTAALLITLTGARYRLQAPLLLGGTVLVLDALHELAPYIVQVVDALPRWLPPALAGLLLLAIGATYEKRLRDARRVRDVLGRMH
ncbi:SCO7613 C-terminal domain-containing membrane protein [Streptomyces longisporoflavus]|uniref:SCO7613 C-terminal domain-containing membrane protein n=1 Tax=Streptomyces longisporoflavus TaxID=28044 RepID=A0ABW7R1Z6_9ACTN